MAAAIAIGLSFITIILLLIFLIRFKKIFSTESIIEKTKSYMDKMIRDINSQTKRDLDLVSDSSKRLRALLNETEHKMEQFREASRVLQERLDEAEKLTKPSGESPLYAENKNVSAIKPVRKPSGAKKSSQKNAAASSPSLFGPELEAALIDPDSSFEISGPRQKSLFDAEEESARNNPILDDVTNVMPDGSAYKHVPLIITRVLDEEPEPDSGVNSGGEEKKSAPAKKIFERFRAGRSGKKEFSEQVMELFSNGLQVEQIANELECSITEVQFVIDMGL